MSIFCGLGQGLKARRCQLQFACARLVTLQLMVCLMCLDIEIPRLSTYIQIDTMWVNGMEPEVNSRVGETAWRCSYPCLTGQKMLQRILEFFNFHQLRSLPHHRLSRSCRLQVVKAVACHCNETHNHVLVVFRRAFTKRKPSPSSKSRGSGHVDRKMLDPSVQGTMSHITDGTASTMESPSTQQ
jgi:hypothetical protein